MNYTSNMMGLYGPERRRQNIITIITNGRSPRRHYIARYMKTPTVRFQRDAIYIIRTVTQKTIPLLISSAWIGRNTLENFGLTRSIRKNRIRLGVNIGRGAALRATVRWCPTRRRIEKRPNIHAFCVERSSRVDAIRRGQSGAATVIVIKRRTRG